MAEIRLDDVSYPLVDAEDSWRVVSQSEVLTDIWDEWVEMGHPRRFKGGYYYGGGFDPTSGVLRLAPFYHALNNTGLTQGYGYFMPAGGALQTITYRGTTSGTADDTSITVNHTVSSGNYRIVIASLSMVENLSYTPLKQLLGSPPTFAGQTMTLFGQEGTRDSTKPWVFAWYLVDPPVGANDCVVWLPGTYVCSLAVADVTGVHPKNPVGSWSSAEGTSTTPSVAVASATNELVLDVVASASNTDPTKGAGQTERWDEDIDSTSRGMGSTEAGAASVTMSWTAGNAAWAIGGVSLKRAGDTLMFCSDGTYIYKYRYDSQVGLTLVATSGPYANGVPGRPVYANGKWYAPFGAGANVRRLDDVDTPTWADAGFTALHMSTYQKGAHAGFARAHTVNKVDITYDTGNLTDWSGDDFPVGDTSTAITDLNEISGELIVSKEDVAYQFDSEGTSRPIGTFKNRGYTDADNGRGTKVWMDRAFIPSNQGLDRYVIGQRLMGVGINRILGFRDVPGITPPRSRRHAYVEAVGHSIYVQANAEETTGLMHARHRENGDPMGGELVWNHVLEIPLSKGMGVDGQNNLWLKGASADEGSRDIRVIELDDNGGLQKALRRGQASSVHEIWFDETDFTYPDETKQFASLMIETSNWATGASLQASIYRDDGTVEDVGDPITSATLTELTWTVGTSDTGRRGRLRLALTTDATYTPLTSDPLILHVTAKARTPVVHEYVIDASPQALSGYKYDAPETLKVLRRLVSAGFKNVGEPGVEAVFEGEVVAVRERVFRREDKSEAYEIPVLVRRWVIT